jgi:hypothetical protein
MTTFQLTIDCRDPARLVRFWCVALDYVPAPPPPGHDSWNAWYRSVGVPEEDLAPDGEEIDRVVDPAGLGPKIWFQLVPEPKTVKNRLHLDLDIGWASDGARLPLTERTERVRAKADELIRAGATELRTQDDAEWDRYYVVLADPEGNEFCLR